MELRESKMISDELEEEGLNIGDYVEVRPLTGKSYQVPINRTLLNFVSEDNIFKASKYYKKLQVFKGDSIFIKIQRIEFLSYNKKKKERLLIQSLNNRPFFLNKSPVFAAILKNGDECEVGHNILVFHKNETRTNLSRPQILNNKKLLKSNLSILLTGETGSGKTTLAHEIHVLSGRKGGFVHINLAAFAPGLLESELFGHKKGAFTGAMEDKKGALRQANGGTLFLDEIDSVPFEIQTKLLLFLDNGLVRPVGESRDFKVSCRLIFASGTSLMQKVAHGKIRKDFFFRISSGQEYYLPSLRNDPHLIKSYCVEFARDNDIYFEKRLIEFYQTLPWPGNLRQLKGHLQRKQALTDGRVIHFDQLDDNLIVQSTDLSSLSVNEGAVLSMQKMREAYALKVFYSMGKRYKAAAVKLEISVKSLKGLLEKSELVSNNI